MDGIDDSKDYSNDFICFMGRQVRAPGDFQSICPDAGIVMSTLERLIDDGLVNTIRNNETGETLYVLTEKGFDVLENKLSGMIVNF
ncbi:MAG: hypothetical protein A3205_05755 [Methanomassiliicoccales archaeon Mx-03]|nr:MAG: hypothetical protein A3205_05755 [Methanomassiliicoccales archaeon Mx-03]